MKGGRAGTVGPFRSETEPSEREEVEIPSGFCVGWDEEVMQRKPVQP